MNIRFIEWLSGLIDGDGRFLLSQKGYGSLEITVDVRDVFCLSIIKKHYGGSIKLRSGNNSLRYRLHDKVNLLKLLNDLNGYLRNSTRLLTYDKLCNNYGIIMLKTNQLTFDNGWMAGFFDADGTITIDNTTNQLSISISQKTQELLLPLIDFYGGHVYIDRSSNTFKWYLTKKEDILYLLNNYFKKQYIFTKKRNRLFLIYKYYDIMDLYKQKNPLFEKIWSKFLTKWNNYISDENLDNDMYHD